MGRTGSVRRAASAAAAARMTRALQDDEANDDETPSPPPKPPKRARTAGATASPAAQPPRFLPAEQLHTMDTPTLVAHVQRLQDEVERRATLAPAVAPTLVCTSTQQEVNAEKALLDNDSSDALPTLPEEAHLGDFDAQVVGLRYYTGVVGSGENVMLVREPNNPYDSNAIKANNVLGIQVGHVKRETAAALAPLMDQKLVRVEGTIFGGGTANTYVTSVRLSLYGLETAREHVAVILKKHHITMRKQTAHPVVEMLPSHADLLGRGVQMDFMMTSSMLDSIFNAQSNAKLSITPAKAPSGLTSELLGHQAQGLAWMLMRENPPPPTEKDSQLFWTYSPQTRMYHNYLTLTSVPTIPTMPRGGLLADEMGLGKTIQVIALILADMENIANKKEKIEGEIKATLIICPVSVLGNWQTQLEAHVQAGKLQVYIFHGPSRNAGQTFLSTQDIILTTYQTVSQDLPRLAKMNFRRVVLDEGHSIKNHLSKMAQAVCAIPARRRWVISGTPIQNKVEDLYSMIKFLRIIPFDDLDWYNRLFTRPINKHHDKRAIQNLQVLIAYITLRRLKTMVVDGKPIIDLPKKAVYLHKVPFSPQEQEVYDKLQREARNALLRYQREGTLSANFANVLAMCTRLRQLCNHQSLVASAILESLHISNIDPNDFLRKPEGRPLLKALLDHESDECPICLENVNIPTVPMCGHVFCKSCILQVIETNPTCPLCRRALSKNQVFSAPVGEDLEELLASQGDTQPLHTAPEAFKSSAKIDALIAFLTALRTKDPHTKSVVFSQWTSMLDLVEIPLRHHAFVFRRLDGSMTRRQRDRAINDFQTQPDATVILVSLKCGSLGINLTAATNAFILDPWWNPASEDQAIDRIHRIGQKNDVTIVRFVIEGTIEDRVIDLQQEKRELAKQTIGGGSDTDSAIKSRRLQDLKTLFQIDKS